MRRAKNMPRGKDGLENKVFGAIRSSLVEGGAVKLALSVRPGQGITRIQGVLSDGTVKVDIAAVPEQGKANDALLHFFEKNIDIAGISFSLKGGISRKKTLYITRSHS